MTTTYVTRDLFSFGAEPLVEPAAAVALAGNSESSKSHRVLPSPVDEPVVSQPKPIPRASDKYPETLEWESLPDKQRSAWLRDRAKRLDVQSLAGTKFYESGVEAASHGWVMADCPYVPCRQCDEWLAGWLVQSRRMKETGTVVAASEAMDVEAGT